MKLYLAGPMRGLPDHNHPAFDAAAALLRSEGHEVFNPAERHAIDTPWAFCIPADLKVLSECEAIIFLQGWEKSQGARIEALFAIGANIPTYFHVDPMFSAAFPEYIFGPFGGSDSGPVPHPTPTLHYSLGKSGVDQIPPEFLLTLGNIYTYGEGKYGRNNWKTGTNWFEFYGSALRHLLKFWKGEELDDESGLPHLAHAAWNIVTLHYYHEHKLGNDSRE